MSKKGIEIPKVGMRTVKTALASLMCLLFYDGLHFCAGFIPTGSAGFLKILLVFLNNCNVLYALISAVIGMQSTLESSVKYGKNRLIGTAVGGILSLIAATVIHFAGDKTFDLILVPLGIVGVIYICNLLKVQGSISIGLIVYLVIIISVNEKDPLIYAVTRWIDTVIGIMISIGVNKFIKSPKV